MIVRVIVLLSLVGAVVVINRNVSNDTAFILIVNCLSFGTMRCTTIASGVNICGALDALCSAHSAVGTSRARHTFMTVRIGKGHTWTRNTVFSVLGQCDAAEWTLLALSVVVYEVAFLASCYAAVPTFSQILHALGTSYVTTL